MMMIKEEKSIMQEFKIFGGGRGCDIYYLNIAFPKKEGALI